MIIKQNNQDIKAVIKHNITVFGEPGTGKTEFAASLPGKKLFINTDQNINRFINDKDIIIQYVKSNNNPVTLKNNMIKKVDGWEFFSALVDEAIASKEIDTIVVDLVEDIHLMLKEYVLKTEGIEDESQSKHGKAWGTIKKLFREVFTKLFGSDKNIVILGHSLKYVNKQTDEVVIEKELWGKLTPFIEGRSQFVFQSIKKNVNGVIHYGLEVQKHSTKIKKTIIKNDFNSFLQNMEENNE